MKNIFLSLAGLILSLGLSATGVSSVLADDDHDQARQLREAGEILPLETILAKVRDLGMGQILEVDLKKKHGRYVYKIETLDQAGVVWELVYDARSGEQLKQEKEDD
jgi:uncharacterized membrane protein YkoI